MVVDDVVIIFNLLKTRSRVQRKRRGGNFKKLLIINDPMVFVGDRTCLFVRAKSKNIGCDSPAGAALT